MAEAERAQRWVDVPVALPPVGQSAAFEVEGHELLLCNADGEAYVVSALCPHARVSMVGALLRGTVLECPLHGGRLDVRDGSPQGMPIRRPGVCHALRSTGEGWQVAVPV